jgi:hypothetical protein
VRDPALLAEAEALAEATGVELLAAFEAEAAETAAMELDIAL